MKKFPFEYTVCKQPDNELFYKQCLAFERKFPALLKYNILEDVDGSLYQAYHHKSGDFAVVNDCVSGCLYVESEFDLLPYFKDTQ